MNDTALVECVNFKTSCCQAYAIHMQYIIRLMELVLPILLSHKEGSLLATDQGFVQIQD